MKKIAFLVLVIFSFISSQVFAFDEISAFENNKNEYNLGYKNLEKSLWKKYFKKQAKIAQKLWQKSEIHKDLKYDTSFARVFLLVNKEGKIVSYEIKSTCVPYKDEKFINEVNNFLSKVIFAKLPSEYNFDLIAFTLKLHKKLPDRINPTRINWNSYGYADIELDSKDFVVIPRRMNR